MQKRSQQQNLNTNSNPKTAKNKKADYISAFGYVFACLLVAFVATEVLAVFDLDKGIKAATDPLVKFANDHWGKFVALSGVATATVSEGDMRTRAIRAGVGCGAAGTAVLLIMAALT